MEQQDVVMKASRGRTVAFRIVAGLLGVAAIVLTVPFAIVSLFDDAEAIHRMHNLAAALSYGLLLGGSLVVCARRPEQSIGPFCVAIASAIGSALAGIIAGDFISGIYFVGPVAVLILIALHPARKALVTEDVDALGAALAVLAVVPAVAFALTQAGLQRNGFAVDPHVEFHHYSGMATVALTLPLSGFAAALRVRGRRVAAWLAGISALGLGVGSLALADHLGAFDAIWAWLAVVWGLAVIGTAEAGLRRASSRR